MKLLLLLHINCILRHLKVIMILLHSLPWLVCLFLVYLYYTNPQNTLLTAHCSRCCINTWEDTLPFPQTSCFPAMKGQSLALQTLGIVPSVCGDGPDSSSTGTAGGLCLSSKGTSGLNRGEGMAGELLHLSSVLPTALWIPVLYSLSYFFVCCALRCAWLSSCAQRHSLEI